MNLLLFSKCAVCGNLQFFTHFFYARDHFLPRTWHRRCQKCFKLQEAERAKRKQREHEEYLEALRINRGPVIRQQDEQNGASSSEGPEAVQQSLNADSEQPRPEPGEIKRVRKKRRRTNTGKGSS